MKLEDEFKSYTDALIYSTHINSVSCSCADTKKEKSANAIRKVFYISIQNVTEHAKDFHSEVVKLGSVNESSAGSYFSVIK